MRRSRLVSWFIVSLALSLAGWRREDFRASCPCMPGYEGDESASSFAEEGAGCGCSLQFRCVCGVVPHDEDEQADVGAPEEEACDEEGPVTLYLSADDSNSMSSPVQARAAVLDGFGSVTAVPIRPWEFFNYYDFAYPPAPAGELAVTAEMGRARDAADRYVLQIGVRSPALTKESRPPIDVTLVLDTSGSMEGEPLALLQAVCRAIAANLRAGDHASVVTWNSAQSEILAGHAVAGPDDPEVLAAIAGVTADGSTDLHGGLVAGYALAAQTAGPGRVGRVILISDGGANTGVTDIDLIAAHAGAEDEDGIYMVGVGVGSGSTYHDGLMDAVTDAGKGAAVFVPDADEAWRMFDERFLDTLLVAARDVQVRVDLPPGFAIERFSGEEYSADPAEVEPQHLAPNDAMVLHQRLVTCAPALVSDASELTVTARYLDAATFQPREVKVTRTFAELFADGSPRLVKGGALLAYTDALTAARLGSPDAGARVQTALQAVGTAELALPGDADLAEIRAVLQML